MKELDRYTIEENQVPSCVLMERAALAVFSEITSRIGKEKTILVVCGTGNNGGDGIAIARLLHLAGYSASVYVAGDPQKMTEETRRQYTIAVKYGVVFQSSFEPRKASVLVDALFGVGLSREITGIFRDQIEEMNSCDAFRVSVDIPSGIDGDTGRVLGCAFRADLTVTFAFLKRGLCLYPGREYAGTVVTADIGIYGSKVNGSGDIRDAGSLVYHLEKADLQLIPKRRMDGHKGTFGKVLLIAGTAGMCGAAYFSAAAALACGVGMVQILTDPANRVPLQMLLPEAIINTSETEEEWNKVFGWCDTLIIGPGLGTSPESLHKLGLFLKWAAASARFVVLDADGLNLLSENPELRKYLGPRTVITPHLGEMARLTGKTVQAIKNDPVKEAVSFASENNCCCILKDACTITASPDGRIYLNLSGNDGMGTAGAGDVLSGIEGGFLCVNRENSPDASFLSALGVFVHGLAGDRAAGKSGRASVTAGKILDAIPGVLNDSREDADMTGI